MGQSSEIAGHGGNSGARRAARPAITRKQQQFVQKKGSAEALPFNWASLPDLAVQTCWIAESSQ
jgi:hypothetical protein